MSYDLRFASTDGRPAPTEASFLGHFAGRPNYKINGAQAWYGNEATGVYFSFEFEPDHAPPEDEDEEERKGLEAWLPTIASFSLNFNRPSTFGVEAAGELEAFLSTFDLLVDDPQIDGMGRGKFSREKFLSSWGNTNQWACSALRENSEGKPPLTYPREQLTSAWKWNLNRATLQASLGEDVFVPRISFAVRDGVVRSFAVWPDAIPVYIPQVDVVLIVRDQLAHRRWFRKKEPQSLLVPWSAVESVLASYPRSEDPMLHIQARYREPSPGIIELVKREWEVADKDRFAFTAPDSVLDAEYFK